MPHPPPPPGGPHETDPVAGPADPHELDDLLLGPAVGWRARLDDLTGGLSSSALRPGVLAVGAAVLVVAVVAWRWSPGPAPAPPELPPLSVPTTAPGHPGGGPAGGPAPTAATGVDGGPTSLVVHVVGAVAAPGVQDLPAGTRVVDALAAAGGATPEADLDQLNLAQPVVDGSQIRVPRRGEVLAAPVTGPSSTAGGPEGTVPVGPVSLSTASPTELESLPGVGPATAEAIVRHRQEHGPFRTVEDLLAVRGIGEKRLEDLRDLVVP